MDSNIPTESNKFSVTTKSLKKIVSTLLQHKVKMLSAKESHFLV